MATQENNPTPSDFQAIIHAASELMEGVFPGMPEVIHELDRQHLGRALTMWGVEDSDNETELVGYCLPLDQQQTQHVVVFESGRICQIGAIGDAIAFREYQKKFAPNERPIVIEADDREQAEMRYIRKFEKQFGETMLRNNNSDHTELLEDSFVRAWETAAGLKAQRDAAKKRTAQRFVHLFSGKLNLTYKDPLAEEL